MIHSPEVIINQTFSYQSYISYIVNSQVKDTVKIERILVTTSKYAFESGKFRRFKVETRMTRSESWMICKGEYSVRGSYRPHQVNGDVIQVDVHQADQVVPVADNVERLEESQI